MNSDAAMIASRRFDGCVKLWAGTRVGVGESVAAVEVQASRGAALGRGLGERARSTIRKNHDRKKIASKIARIHARLGSRSSNRGLRGNPRGVRGWRRLMASVRATNERSFCNEDD